NAAELLLTTTTADNLLLIGATTSSQGSDTSTARTGTMKRRMVFPLGSLMRGTGPWQTAPASVRWTVRRRKQDRRPTSPAHVRAPSDTEGLAHLGTPSITSSDPHAA
ncbi:MAG TPA: hypothetical protein VGQ52_19495, partial [Gemmatimonadaceae bacterium]|nr:hypothetical protein [Gemmatimonadaceae bacterium]